MASIKAYETTTGERRYLVRWRANRRERSKGAFRRRRDAERFAAEVDRKKIMGALYEAAPETFGDYLDGWLERHRMQLKDSSHRRQAEAVRGLPRSLRDAPVSELTVADVEDAVLTIAARAPRQAQMALATVKAALKDARRRGHTIADAILEITPPRAKEKAPRFLTWAEVENLASWMPDDCGRLVLLAALTGARQGELFRLTWGDVDLDAGSMAIGESKTEAGVRSVDLPPLAVEVLSEQALTGGSADSGGAQPPAVSRAGSSERNPAPPPVSALVFPAPRGGTWTGDNFGYRVFRPAAKAAKLNPLPFHSLRHTYASLMIEAGVNVKDIADQLGHADGGALVLRRYGHRYKGAGKAAALKLDALVRGAA